MSKFTTSTDSKTDSTTTPTDSSTGYVDPTPPADDNNEVDDFGYGTADDANKIPAPPAATPPAPVKKEEAKPAEKPVSGYGDEDEPTPPADDKKKDASKADETPPSDEEKLKQEIEASIKELPASLDHEKVLKFVTENKLSKDQVEAYKKLIVDEEKNREEEIKTTRAAWRKELKEDPEFGGENFARNVDQVEKVLQNYMPNMKKQLTERGTVLPPYIMKDLLSLSKALNPKATFESGEPPSVEDDKDNFLDSMYS